jgi:hypothetical protein
MRGLCDAEKRARSLWQELGDAAIQRSTFKRVKWRSPRARDLPADSRDGDQVFQAMVITDSSDRDQFGDEHD